MAAIATIIVSLFIGGWVAAQMTVGENRQEAILYGVLTWGTVTIVSLGMVAMGVRAGYFAAVGGSAIIQNNERVQWEQADSLGRGCAPRSRSIRRRSGRSLDPVRARQ